MSPSFLETFFVRKDLLEIMSQTFVTTISNYTRTVITAEPPTLGKTLDKKDAAAVGFIRYEGKEFGFELALTMSKEPLFIVYQSAFYQEITEATNEAKDLVGEFLNIAFGTIDVNFSAKGIKMRSSFPKTHIKNLSALLATLPAESICFPFAVSGKKFFLEVFPLNSIDQKWDYTIVKNK